MNFKPTKWKIIVCLVLLIVVSITLGFLVLEGNNLSDCGRVLNQPTRAGEGTLIGICQNQSTFFLLMFLSGLIVAGLIYIIWSLIQKKRLK